MVKIKWKVYNTNICERSFTMGKKVKMKKKPFYKKAGFYLSVIYVLLTAGLIAQLLLLNVLPMKYAIPAIIVLVLIMLGLCALQLSKKINRMNSVLGKILMVLLSVLLAVGNVYVFKAGNTLGKITTDQTQVKSVSVIVMKDSKAEAIKDLKNDTFGVQKTGDQDILSKALDDINKDTGNDVSTTTYTSNESLINDLYDGNINALVMDEGTRALFEDTKEKFTEETKIVHTYEYKTETKKIGEKVDVTKEPYNVYITGMDTYGEIQTTSRSDVNMIASVNPATNQILLTSVPRDYYIEQTCQGNQKDKLTHTGIFGVDCTVESMQNFMGIKMNYYVRVNFSSLEKIVNAIGGIDVNNPVAFYSGVDGSYIPAGDLHMDGNTALKFARERKAYEDGDRQRGRNQMIVLEAIIKQAISPSIITGYMGIMDAVGGNIQTNMEENDMTSIIKQQLDDMKGWDVKQISVTGAGLTMYSPANGFDSYVMDPNMGVVNSAVSLINKIDAGETVTDDDITKHNILIDGE